jgi:Spy/CpxP family protein refolding chaperone
MRRLTSGIAAAIVLAGAAPLGAQQQRPLRQAPPARQNAPDSFAATPERAQLEAQLRQRMGQVVRRQLQLSDAQFRQLSAVNRRYDERRKQLLQQERGIRTALRDELMRGAQADQGRVSGLLDDLMRLQQDRLDLLRQEQREMSTFLTPVQRAKYAALEEQMRRRINEFRRRELAPGDGPAAWER